MKGGDTGPALVPGDPEHSLLIKAVRYQDENLQMPPKGRKLSPEQVADLKRGSNWARRIREPFYGGSRPDGLDRQHWSFQPIQRPAVPVVINERWVKSPVDAFVLAKLEAKGMSSAPQADRRTLIRRTTYDLTGLPPTPKEVTDFLEDKSADAFARVVDRLLDSPRYGERWARHWLDVALRGYEGLRL